MDSIWGPLVAHAVCLRVHVRLDEEGGNGDSENSKGTKHAVKE